MSTSLRTARPRRRRGLLGIATTIAMIGTFLVPLAMNTPAALADTSAQIGSGVECANDMWQAETTADNAGHVYVIYSNYCSNHDFLWYQVSNDGGQTFGAAQTLCTALGATCTAAASTHTIGGTAYKTEDDPSLYVDTTVTPPKLYAVWDATPSFASFSPDVVLGAVSSDFGTTFTMLNGGANIAGANCGNGGNNMDCGFPQVTARGSNVTVSTGSYATGGAKSNQIKIVGYSSNGGTSFASYATNGTGATNGNYYYALRSVLDSLGNTWTLWLNVDGSAGTGNFLRYQLSKTTVGTSTTTWVTTFYTAPDGPTYPGQGMASGGGYPAGWWGGAADLAIDGANRLTVVFQDGRGHTTDGAPSILRAGSCALASGTCTALGAAAGQWTTQAAATRVDDKDATGCGGTEALATAKCSVSFPRLVSTSGGTLSLSWVDDRLASNVGCGANPRFSHVCGLNMWMRQSSTGISGFTSPSVKLSDHAGFSPVWDSDNAGFKFFYGGSSGITTNPACTNQPFAAWAESVDYNGGSTNGGRVFVKNAQSGPASSTSLTATPASGQVDLSWPASTSGGVTGYKVYRGSGSTGDNLTLLTTLGNVTSYSNTGLSNGQTFTYAVSAIVGGSEGCQSVRASATAGAVVRTLTLATTPGAVGCANITTTPAPSGGNGTCSRTYADGTVVTLSATSPVPIDASSRYRFSAWSGDATGSGSPTVTMSAARSVTAAYVKQWAVTVQATGLTCDAPLAFYCDTGNNTVATVNATTYTGSDLAYAGQGFPTKAYVDDGGTLTYSYGSPLAVPGSTDLPQTLPPNANKQYRLDAVSGPASGSTVTSAVTIDGTYVTQRKVTFAQTGIGGDSSGTVVQVNGTGTNPANASLAAGSLGSAAFYDNGSTWAFQSPVAAGSNKRYAVGTTSGTLGAADEGTTKTGAYGTQWLLTLATNPGGIGTGHITPNPTSADGFYNSNTSVTLTADATASSGGSPHTFQNWTGDVAAPPNSTNPVSITMNQARSVTANYALDAFALDVSKTGNGSGSVSSSPAGITCGATCSNSFNYGTVVTLTATPATGSTFSGWTGAGCSGTGDCVVTVDAAKSVSAGFTLQTFALDVSKTGNGSGSVSSSPAGITCGATCSNSFNYGTVVTLTATPATGSTFSGWTGAGCSGTGDCVVTVDAAKSVSAGFTLQTFALDVSKTGNGSGSVSSSPAGITCGATCSNSFNYGTVVTLTATPATGSTFSGWTGAGCSGTGDCVVTVDAAKSVSAGFTLQTFALDVSKTGNGSGSVSSSPAGITCGATCSNSFNYGTVVTLTATPATGSTFSGWTGAGCSGTGDCVVTVDAAKSVSAGFTLQTFALDVSKTGNGSGSVSSSPAGITCGATCSNSFNYGTVVTLTATPATGSTFSGWTGAGCSGTGDCVVTVDAAKSVSAQFTLQTRTLDVTLAGVGSGSVSSSPAGITCGATCSHAYDYGTVVTLTATPNSGSVFTAWSGSGCSGTGDCVVTMDAARSVTASFSDQPQQLLDVTKAGTGDGLVTSSPARVDCGATCSITFDFGTVVTLSAAPDAVSNFTGWSGEGCSGTGDCVVTMDAARSVTATFTLKPPKTLDVSADGTGTGSVASSPAGIDCGLTCSHAFAHGTVVTLTATPATGSDFAGWTGAGCSGTGDCVVTMDAARSVTATFTLETKQLDVSKDGNGAGSVSSSPAGITCGATCSHNYDYSTVVTLSATPATGSDFTGWTGEGCSGTGDCVVTMDAARSVTATFTLETRGLDVTKDGTGTGSVTSSPAGIDCGLTCSTTFNYGTVVTLSATPATGSDFTGWTGAGCSGTGDCVVTLDAARSVTATFTLETRSLDVSKSGTGGGVLTSSPAAIDCGVTCSANLDYGTVVTLTATPNAGSVFAGWSGDCTGTGNCVLTMDAAHTATATFTLIVHKPDELIGTSTNVSKMVGGNIYNATGTGQSKGGKAHLGAKKTFYVLVQNDGNATDTFVIVGSKKARGFSVKYFVGTTDVTKLVTAGTYEFQNLAPGASQTMKIVVKVKSTATVGAVQKLTVKATAKTTAILDVVKAKVKAIR